MCCEVLAAAGTASDIAAEVARHLVRANLSGHDSHGVRLLPRYVARIDAGDIDPAARPEILRETDTTALVDAHYGFAHFAIAFAVGWAIERARRHGTAAVAVRHATHAGRLGEFTERIADAGLAGILTVGAAGPGVGGMQLLGTTHRFFGANPWSFTVPATLHERMVFDGSSSAIAEGKVDVAVSEGRELPAGAIVDAQGRPTTNPQDLRAGGALRPLGGDIAGHKGYGLALASALFSAMSMIDDGDPSLIGAAVQPGFQDAPGKVGGVFLVVVDPAAFGRAGAFGELVDSTLAAIKAIGEDKVLLPGEAESRLRVARERTGIALDEALRGDLESLASRFGVPLPEGWPEG
jgi:LDH2 family malate/lactate/ureidoglycolate dehydrogenase